MDFSKKYRASNMERRCLCKGEVGLSGSVGVIENEVSACLRAKKLVILHLENLSQAFQLVLKGV